MDESNTEIVVTLWGAQAESIDAALGSILAIKNCRVGDYNGVCAYAFFGVVPAQRCTVS